MSEPLVDATTPSFLLDGELPRLGDAPAPPTSAPATGTTAAGPTAFAPPTATSPSHTTGPSPTLSAPGAAPVLTAPTLPSLPSHASPPVAAAREAATIQDAPTDVAAEVPSLPAAVPTLHHAGPASPASEAVVQPATEHPMAHLMPQASAPSEASRRAAEIRASKKAKARKVKIGVAVGTLVVVAVVGPPVGRWVVDAVNDAGSTTTDVDE